MSAQTLSSLFLPRPATSRPNIFACVAQWLIEADARARERRHLEDLPDRLRADAGLPPRSPAERDLLDLYLRCAPMR